ncbi:MAG TPA: hypothetical protein DCO75_12055 [Fibrobacteres bacterium]|jgi:CRISPR-associated protein Csm4|nr:hypothetical protein [Fibrobacterota bacterium]
MLYRFSVCPKSKSGTPLRSDILFGHFCWMLKLTDENKFKTFIDNAASENPEIIFSDGFPSGHLPRPLLHAFTTNEDKIPDLMTYQKDKSLRKKKWINAQTVLEDTWTGDMNIADEKCPNSPEIHSMLHAVIDRFNNSSLENNGLYSVDEIWYVEEWKKIDIYINADIALWPAQSLTDALKLMLSFGYGKDTTSGCGVFDLTDGLHEINFPDIGDSQYCLNLSRCVPDDSIDLEKSFYEIEPKYGKTWQPLNHEVPFKKPILQTVPGSVFFRNFPTLQHTCGRVLRNVHAHDRVIENCMAITIPLRKEAVTNA